MATWQPSTEDIQDVLTAQNPWLLTGQVPAPFAPPTERALAKSLWARSTTDDPRRFHLVLGPRRVGKTTVMYQTVRRLLDSGVDKRRIWWIRLDHPLLLQFDLNQLVQLPVSDGRIEKPVYVFLDELVYARDWDLWLKSFYDERLPIRVVATSSATAALSTRRQESGIGRWEEQYLMPFLFTEFLDLIQIGVEVTVENELAASITRAIEDPPDLNLVDPRELFTLTGGFPELLVHFAQAGEEASPGTRLLESQRILRGDAVERAIYKDIPQVFRVDNPMALERMLYTLAGQVTGILSPTRIGGELGVSQPTIDRYLSYLERAFLVFTLPNYSGREASVQRRGRKLYFVDGAVRNAALQRGLAPLDNPTELGALLENLVASHMRSLALETQVRLYHWRDGHDEVDLIYDHPEAPLALEIASSADHPRSGLTALMERYPRFRGACYLVAPGIRALHPSKGRSGVGTLPVDLLLCLIGRQFEQALRQRMG